MASFTMTNQVSFIAAPGVIQYGGYSIFGFSIISYVGPILPASNGICPIFLFVKPLSVPLTSLAHH